MTTTTTTGNLEDQTATSNANGRHMRGLIWLCGVLMVLVSTAIVYFVWMMSELYSLNFDT